MRRETVTLPRDDRMKPAARAALVILVALGMVAACAERSHAPGAPNANTVSSSTLPPLEGMGGDGGGPALCGCKLCAPHPGDDACSSDADCAPKTACHATECVARAHAAPQPSGTMCTQLFACASVDANPCGCWQGKCALVPR